MEILVINLDRSPERLQQFQKTNSHLRATRFPAIDGKTANRADLLRQKIFEEPVFYTDGAVGHALSHLKLWNIIAQKDPAYATVLEDDAIVHKDFITLAPPLIAQLPADWDFVLWGWNFDAVMSFDLFSDTPCLAHFSQNELRRHWQSIQQGAIQPALRRLHYAFGTVGYSISKAGAKKLAARTVPIKPFLYRIPALAHLEIQNNALDCVLATLYDQINAFVCFPPLILTKNEHAASTIQQAKHAPNKTECCFKLTPSADYPNSRKFRRKYARYLRQNGDIGGAARTYLKYFFTGRTAGKA